jgi:DNA mismatch endonuclease (patch repair protein)
MPDAWGDPKHKQDYWIPKRERNKQRDRENTAALKDEGWTIIRVREHEIKDICITVERIIMALP